MNAAAFLRVKKLKASGIVLAAARHNLREIQAELGAGGNIDPTRTHLNVRMHGPNNAADVAALAKARMQAAGVGKLRKDAVQAIELVFSLPPGYAVDTRPYFTNCLAWTAARFGADNILSAVAHHDEAAPHVHVLLLPLVGNKMAGSDLVGNRRTLADMQASFHSVVASHHGLRKTSDGALRSAAWATIREAIEREPAPFMQALGLHLPEQQKPTKTMAQIFTSKGKGPRREPQKPIGFGVDDDAEPYGFAPLKKDRTLCSVGFAPNQPAATRPQAIETLSELWAAVGCKSKRTTPRADRLHIARTAQRQAMTRCANKPASPAPQLQIEPADDDGITRVRDEYTHDTSAWNSM